MIKTKYIDKQGQEHEIKTLQTANGFDAIFDGDKINKEVVVNKALTEEKYHETVRELIKEEGGTLIEE